MEDEDINYSINYEESFWGELRRSFLYKILSKKEYSVIHEHYSKLVFKDRVDRKMKCSFCDRVAIDHFVADYCEHLYCNFCCAVISHKLNNKCPKCWKEVGGMTARVVEITIRVFALDVYCPNRPSGCEFISTLLELGSHIEECLKVRRMHFPIEVPNEIEQEIALKYPTKFSWLLDDTRNILKLRDAQCVLISRIMRCLSHPFSFTVSYNFRTGRIFFTIYLDHRDGHMERPYPRVKYIITDGSEKSSKVYVRKAQLLFNEKLEDEKHQYIVHIDFEKLKEFEKILINVEMKVEMKAEIFDGVLNWEINDYGDKFRLEESLSVARHYKPIFFTNPKEYAVMVDIKFHGERNLCVRIISGPNDGSLTKSKQRFLAIVHFHILNLPVSSFPKEMKFAKLSNKPTLNFSLIFLRYFKPYVDHKFFVTVTVMPVNPSKLKIRTLPALKSPTE